MIPAYGLWGHLTSMGFIKDLGKAAGKVVKDVSNEAKRGAKKAGQAVENVGAAVVDAHQDVANAIIDAHEDAGRAAVKAVRDVFDAGKATAHYLERKLQSQLDAAAAAERRMREGKVLDALWHTAVDPLAAEEANALKTMQESHVLRAIGQTAATAYGGPGGAAAFAAWYTYRTTGDAELAFRVGVISGVTSAGMSAAGSLPADTVGQVTAKAAITGAMGGLAVAAGGGDAKAIREGFLRAGAMVLVQDGYKEFTRHELDARAATKGPLEMSALDDDCFVKDAQGDFVLDRFGQRVPDYTLIDHRYSFVGRNSPADPEAWLDVSEHGAVMRGAGQIPGMNAMGLFHDQWVASWDMNYAQNLATIPVAIVITYLGTDSHVLEQVRQAAVAEAKPLPKPLVVPAPVPAKPKPERAPRDRPDAPGAYR